MTLLDRVLDTLDRLARWVAIAAATVIILILFAQIFFRYFLNSSIVWSEEVATWCLVWLVFIGAASIMRRWDHVQIPMLIRRLPLGIRPGFIIFAKLATAVAVGLVAWRRGAPVDNGVPVRAKRRRVSADAETGRP